MCRVINWESHGKVIWSRLGQQTRLKQVTAAIEELALRRMQHSGAGAGSPLRTKPCGVCMSWNARKQTCMQ